MAVGVPITPPHVRNAQSIVTFVHVGITIFVGTVIFVEDWITVGVLTQVGRWNTLRLVNTLSEARETGEIETDEWIFVPFIATLRSSIADLHWIHTVSLIAAIVSTLKLSRHRARVFITVRWFIRAILTVIYSVTLPPERNALGTLFTVKL